MNQEATTHPFVAQMSEPDQAILRVRHALVALQVAMAQASKLGISMELVETITPSTQNFPEFGIRFTQES
jgi:hypothetical protein